VLHRHFVASCQSFVFWCLSLKRGTQCPLWVTSGHRQRKRPCPLYPQ
jgi:hypothetical protein